jgi:hypothetical protein
LVLGGLWVARVAAQAPTETPTPPPPPKPDDLAAPTLALGGVQYVSVLPLARGLGVKLTWLDGAKGARLTTETRWLAVYAGKVTARSADGPLVLPTCPLVRNDLLMVPTEAVVGQLGGKTSVVDDRLLVTLGAKAVTVALAPEPKYTKVGEKLQADLFDPRVPITDLERVAVQTEELRVYVDGFGRLVRPLKPLLDAAANSRALAVLAHVPVVGQFVTTAQVAAGAAGEALGATAKLAQWDQSLNVPVRKAYIATARFMERASVLGAMELVPVWKDAAKALDKQVAAWDEPVAKLQQLNLALALLDAKTKALLHSEVANKVKVALVVGPALGATQNLLVYCQANRWWAAMQRDYFTRLVGDAELPPLPAPPR